MKVRRMWRRRLILLLGIGALFAGPVPAQADDPLGTDVLATATSAVDEPVGTVTSTADDVVGSVTSTASGTAGSVVAGTSAGPQTILQGATPLLPPERVRATPEERPRVTAVVPAVRAAIRRGPGARTTHALTGCRGAPRFCSSASSSGAMCARISAASKRCYVARPTFEPRSPGHCARRWPVCERAGSHTSSAGSCAGSFVFSKSWHLRRAVLRRRWAAR